MKTLVDIDEHLLKRAMALAQTQTKKETIVQALKELIRSRQRQALKQMAGTGAVEMTLPRVAPGSSARLALSRGDESSSARRHLAV